MPTRKPTCPELLAAARASMENTARRLVGSRLTELGRDDRLALLVDAEAREDEAAPIIAAAVEGATPQEVGHAFGILHALGAAKPEDVRTAFVSLRQELILEARERVNALLEDALLASRDAAEASDRVFWCDLERALSAALADALDAVAAVAGPSALVRGNAAVCDAVTQTVRRILPDAPGRRVAALLGAGRDATRLTSPAEVDAALGEALAAQAQALLPEALGQAARRAYARLPVVVATPPTGRGYLDGLMVSLDILGDLPDQAPERVALFRLIGAAVVPGLSGDRAELVGRMYEMRAKGRLPAVLWTLHLGVVAQAA